MDLTLALALLLLLAASLATSLYFTTRLLRRPERVRVVETAAPTVRSSNHRHQFPETIAFEDATTRSFVCIARGCARIRTEHKAS